MWVTSWLFLIALSDLHPSVFGGRSEGEAPLINANNNGDVVALHTSAPSLREEGAALLRQIWIGRVRPARCRAARR
jgi:hypothetical protein